MQSDSGKKIPDRKYSSEVLGLLKLMVWLPDQRFELEHLQRLKEIKDLIFGNGYS